MSNYITTFKEKSTEQHGDTYSYEKLPPSFSYNTWVPIVCKVHGTFKQKARTHVTGSGCPKCAREIREQKYYSNCRHTKEQFVERAKKTHGDKYDYTNTVYEGQMKSVNIVCPSHGEFHQIANNHIHGNGCAKCSDSRGERKIALLLEQSGVDFIQQHTFEECINPKSKTRKRLPFDFFIPSKNLLIEFDGKHHFEPVPFNGVPSKKAEQLHLATVRNDNLKNRFVERSQYQLVRIPHTFTDKEIRDVVFDKLHPLSADTLPLPSE